MTQLIILNVNIKETTKRLLVKQIEYNLQKKIEQPDSNKLTLKATHIHTAIQLVKMYYKHIERISEAQIENPANAYFEINNVALGKVLGHKITTNKKTGRSECSTAYRHIEKLKQAGIITEIIRHGSKRGKEITLNPELLVVDINEQIQRMFFELYKQHISKQIPDTDFVRICNLKFSFSDVSAKGIIATCNDIELTFYKNFKDKIQKGKPFGLHCFDLQEQTGENREKFFTILPKSNDTSFPPLPPQFTENQITNNNSAIRNPQSAIVNNPATKSKRAIIDRYINMSWQLCFALLFYPFLKRKVYDNEVLNSKYLISVIYEKFIGTPENALQLTEHELKRRLGTAYNQFFVRCYIKRKSILTHPESFLTAPAVWLDETNEYGYASTKEIYKSIMQARKNNKDIYKNQLLVADLWQKYFDNPCTETFRQAQQQLGKLRDKSWLDLFNTCTLKPAEARRLMQKKFECEFK